ncbi:hypothetical protein ACI3PL_26120 [Lacticaseibacillus paracasei]
MNIETIATEAATEARLAAAEAENAQLWQEIEALTAPMPALAA